MTRFEASEVYPGLHWLKISDDVMGGKNGAHVDIIGNRNEVIIIDSAYNLDTPYAFITGYLAGMGHPTVKAIVLTHHHRDHSGGAARLREAFSAPIWCTPAEATRLANPDPPRAEDIAAGLTGSNPDKGPGQPVEAKEGEAATEKKPPEPPEPIIVDDTFVEGDLITAGGITLQAVVTPGHSPGHSCFWHADSGIMFSGDLILGNATTSVSPPWGDMMQLERSLARLLDFPMKTIISSHGPVVPEPVKTVRGVLDHRAERERQVYEFLSAGHTTPKDIAANIYVNLEQRLVPLAGRQVESILRKLAHYGKVAPGGEEGSWRLVSTR